MLELSNITKDYVAGDTTVKALKGVSIKFRRNEFVSILGQSGCGKTTLLNIIGGLDRYTDGDLTIDDISTKQYKDKDWDAYRNNRIGFVFQSYNLIPHQSVLSNVELALTLSGVYKTERRERATKVLQQVGLGDQLHKKPNQMSGGQMQRVAIARALVNDPDILLADEPTGALDSETSIQIMNILKEISKDKLIIMVTHNPELAKEYSSRIIKLLDGNVVDDSMPYDGEKDNKNKAETKSKDKKAEKKAKKEENKAKKDIRKKTSMSFFTALSLSLNNLMTKKTRTLLTSFAGSIGIIGIALILSLSSGMQNYINRVEQDTLSSYPITIEKATMDYSIFMTGGEKKEIENKEDGYIYSNNVMTDMINSMMTSVSVNNLKDFKAFLDDDKNELDKYVNDIQYSYALDLLIYNGNTEDKVIKTNPSTVFESMGMSSTEEGNMMTMSINVWSEMIDNEELIKSQYDVIEGRMPEAFNEVVLVVDEDDMIDDYTLYSLGLLDISEVQKMFGNIAMGTMPEEELTSEMKKFSYEEIMNQPYKLVLNTDLYEKNGKGYVNKSTDYEYMKNVIANSIDIKIVGILRPNEDSSNASITTALAYTHDLTEYVVGKINETEIAKAQLANPTIDVLTGSEFSNNTYENNISNLGIVEIDNPMMINIFPKDFECKEKICEMIDDYNKDKEDAGKDEDVIQYTDYIGLMMSSVSTIIDAISYILIAFVAISLVVSSIMIGIITYISVLERTKEIGILRSIGASKKDISRVFNAETIIVGFTAGLIGILVTILLNIPINMIIKNITDIGNLSKLPTGGAIILVFISMFLTFIAGLIPSKVASKKDPVVALRTD